MRAPLVTTYHLLVLPLAVLSVAISLLFLRYTADVESDELRYRLNIINVRSQALDTSDLLPRLKAELEAVRRMPVRRELPRQELGLLTAFSERAPSAPPARSVFPGAAFVRQVIEWLQRMVGVVPAMREQQGAALDVLTLGYNLERRRLFSEALLAFRQAAQTELSQESRDFVLLHSGVCLVFIGQRKEAITTWQALDSSPIERNRLLAQELIRWLNGVGQVPGAIARSTPRQRAEELYRVMAFKESLDVLVTVAEGSRDQAYYFLRGRVNEAPGNFNAAAVDYRRAIAMGPRNDLATLAARRLYLMGIHYRPDRQLAEQAPRLSAALGDNDFLAFAETLLSATPRTESQVPGYSAGEELEQVIRQAAGEIRSPAPAKPVKRPTVRLRTRNGSVITGIEVRRNAAETVLSNENGNLRIPSGDIESREILSGN